MASLVLHRIEEVEVETYNPHNSNSLRLLIKSDETHFRIEMYGMPEELALRICRALGNAKTVVHDVKGRETLTDYLTFYDVTQKMEGKE